MTTVREQIVAEAREWLGTPHIHQGRLKGVGVDCGGFPICVARERGLVPREKDIHGYSDRPRGNGLVEISDRLMTRIEIDAIQPADIVVIRWGKRDPQHFAIVADYKFGGLSIIHALREVVEQRLDDPMRRRIVAAYLMPGID